MQGYLLQIIAYGSINAYNYKNYSGHNKIGYGKTNPYAGKNNFYKKLKKTKSEKKENIIKKSEINEKNKNFNIANKIKFNGNNKSNTVKSSYNFIEQKHSNNLIRILSIKLYIRNFILSYLIDFTINNNLETNLHLFSETYIKIHKILLFFIISKYDLNFSKNYFEKININDVDISYMLKLKNLIMDYKNIIKIIKILLDYGETLLKKTLKIKSKVIIKLVNSDENNNCIITLEPLDNFYFCCTECNTYYNLDGFEYWSKFNNKCSTKWCTNSIDNLQFYVKRSFINIYNNKYNSDINLLLTYYIVINSIL